MRRGNTYNRIEDSPGQPKGYQEEEKYEIQRLYNMFYTSKGVLRQYIDNATKEKASECITGLMTSGFIVVLGYNYNRNQSTIEHVRCYVRFPNGDLLYSPGAVNPMAQYSDFYERRTTQASYLYWKIPSGENTECVFATNMSNVTSNVFRDSVFFHVLKLYFVGQVMTPGAWKAWGEAVRMLTNETREECPVIFNTDMDNCIESEATELFMYLVDSQQIAFLYAASEFTKDTFCVLGTRDNPFCIDIKFNDMVFSVIMTYVFEINWGIRLMQTFRLESDSGIVDAIMKFICCKRHGGSKMSKVESSMIDWFVQECTLIRKENLMTSNYDNKRTSMLSIPIIKLYHKHSPESDEVIKDSSKKMAYTNVTL
jgi:hypothetical protein